jgi:hypothetical protein
MSLSFEGFPFPKGSGNIFTQKSESVSGLSAQSNTNHLAQQVMLCLQWFALKVAASGEVQASV